MSKKIKQFTIILLILLSSIALFTVILTIWDVIDSTIAKEAFTKIGYTFGAIFIISLFVIYLTKSKE